MSTILIVLIILGVFAIGFFLGILFTSLRTANCGDLVVDNNDIYLSLTLSEYEEIKYHKYARLRVIRKK